MHAHPLICFGARPGTGNPALVIESDMSDQAARQRLAAARNMTCVFIDREDGEARVDYFYPHMRSPLCLHATLAVAQVLFARADAGIGVIGVHTAMKGQRLELSRDADAPDGYFVRLASQPAPPVDVDARQLALLLGAPGLAPVAPPLVASVGSPKLLVEVQDRDTLYVLAPDLAGIAAWGRQHQVSGIYAWCRLDDGRFEGRNFNHLDPALEDSATGVAAGALTAALGRGITLLQGRATGRDCLIRTRVEDGAIFVGGTAEPV